MSSTAAILPALPQAITAPQAAKPVSAAKPTTAAAPTTGAGDADGDNDGSTGASASAASSPFGPAGKVTLSAEAQSLLAAATSNAPAA